MSNLLPCPFCGGQAISAELNAGLFRVGCTICGAIAAPCARRDAAVTAWNHRTVRPATPHKSSCAFRYLEHVVESLELDPRHAAGAILELRFLDRLLVAMATLADTSPAPPDNSPAALVAEFVDAARSGFPA